MMSEIGGPAGSAGWHEVAAALLAARGLLWVGPGGSTKTGPTRAPREASRELHAAVRRLAVAGALDARRVYAAVTLTETGRAALVALMTGERVGTLVDEVRRVADGGGALRGRIVVGGHA
jgi:hypothetical protein